MKDEEKFSLRIEEQIERSERIGRIKEIIDELDFIEEEFVGRDLWKVIADIIERRRSLLEGRMEVLFEGIEVKEK